VEDDGAGWSQYGAWTQSDYGNGFRQHWTYVWNPLDYWARWTPALPYPGYYQIHAFVPFVNATTTNARYEIHRLNVTTIAPINQDNLSDAWASLGTYYLQSPLEYVQLYDYTGEPTWSKQIAADSMKFSASIVHLPYVKNKDGWVSSITVRNNSASTAHFAIDYYNSSGGLVTLTTAAIWGNATATLTPPAGYDGSAVVVSSKDIAVTVREEQNGELDVYTGILAQGGSLGWEQVGTTLYAPIIKNNYNGRS
jgi:hypothetical protein